MKTIKVRNTPANMVKAQEIANPASITIQKGYIVVPVPPGFNQIPDTSKGIRFLKNILGF